MRRGGELLAHIKKARAVDPENGKTLPNKLAFRRVQVKQSKAATRFTAATTAQPACAVAHEQVAVFDIRGISTSPHRAVGVADVERDRRGDRRRQFARLERTRASRCGPFGLCYAPLVAAPVK